MGRPRVVGTNECREALSRAFQIVGGQVELAKVLGVTKQAVKNWHSRGTIPPNHVLQVEEVTGGQVTRYDLRPDIFGEAPDGAQGG